MLSGQGRAAFKSASISFLQANDLVLSLPSRISIVKVTFHNPRIQEDPTCGSLLESTPIKDRLVRLQSSFCKSISIATLSLCGQELRIEASRQPLTSSRTAPPESSSSPCTRTVLIDPGWIIKLLKPSQPPVAAATATAEFRIHQSPPPPTKCGVQNCQWQPYSNSGDFKANTALVVGFLFCTLICGLAINFAIKHMCKRYRRIQSPETVSADTEKVIEVPSLIYSEGMQLAAAEECAICLSEFEIGERIRVLEKCSHGFHMQCIERWLNSCSSCPICRANSR